MKYSEYIKLGFKRTDIDDDVEFRNTGYKGFLLTKELNEKCVIEVSFGELDKPKLYIKKTEATCYIMTLTETTLKDLLK